MCGRVIQSSGPLRYAFVDGMNVRDSRVHNYPPRWNAAPSQELLVIRRNHKTGDVSLDSVRWGLIPSWCKDPTGGRKPINAKCETVQQLPTFRDSYRNRRCSVPVDGSVPARAETLAREADEATNLAQQTKNAAALAVKEAAPLTAALRKLELAKTRADAALAVARRRFTFDYIQTPSIEGYERGYRELAARKVDILAVGRRKKEESPSHSSLVPDSACAIRLSPAPRGG
jgi:SOS response associated peptidase (SRAP)